MKTFIAILISSTFISTTLYGQWGYDTYSKTDGLEISTKWGKARDAEGNRKPALLLSIENHNDFPVTYGFDVNFYYEGILRETGGVEKECIEGLKSRVGKLNGIFFIPVKFTPEQLENSDFSYSIEAIEVSKAEEPCEKEDE